MPVKIAELARRAGSTTTVHELVRDAGSGPATYELVSSTDSAGPGGGGTFDAAPVVGIYYGTPSPSLNPVVRTQTNFRATPRLVSGYIQQNEDFTLGTPEGDAKLAAYKAVIDSGASIYLTLASKNNALYSHNELADPTNAGAQQVYTNWAEFGAAVRAYALSKGRECFIGDESEFEVKVKSGEITGVSNATFAASFGRFVIACRAADPNMPTVYQVGHFAADAILDILSKMVEAFDIMGLDPYRGNGSPQTTMTQTVNSKNLTPLGLRANSDFIRLGTPKIALTETGTHVPGYTDDNLQAWINSIPTAMKNLGILFVIWFNRGSGPNNDSDLITARDGSPQNKPLAVAALADLFGLAKPADAGGDVYIY